MKKESDEHIERLQKEKDLAVANERTKVEKKYSGLHDFVNYTKKLVITLTEAIQIVKSEHQQIKQEMMMLRSSIGPTLLQAQKSVSCILFKAFFGNLVPCQKKHILCSYLPTVRSIRENIRTETKS